MGTVAMSGSDVVIINNRIFNDQGDGDFGVISFPNELMNVKTGKNGNSIYSFNESGKQSDFVIRLIRGSADDKFLNSILANMKSSPAGFILMTGEFIKKMGDGRGNITNDTYIMSGGVFTKEVEAKGNAEGDSEQSIAVHTLKFANAPRTIG